MNVYLWLWLCVLILFVLLVLLPAYFQRRARERREQARIADTAAKQAAVQSQAHRRSQDPEGEHLRPPLWVPTTSSVPVEDSRKPERPEQPLSRSGFIELRFRPAPSRPSAAEAPRFVVGLDPFTDPGSILSPLNPLNPLSPAYSSTASCEPTPAPDRTPHSSDTSAPSSPSSDTSSHASTSSSDSSSSSGSSSDSSSSSSDSSSSCDSGSSSSSGGESW